MVSSSCFEPKVSYKGRRLYVQAWYSVFYMHWHQHEHYKTFYTDACKTHYTMPVFTAVFLKVNLLVRNI